MTFKDYPASRTAGSFNLNNMRKLIKNTPKLTR
jgi:hypothetical protein